MIFCLLSRLWTIPSSCFGTCGTPTCSEATGTPSVMTSQSSNFTRTIRTAWLDFYFFYHIFARPCNCNFFIPTNSGPSNLVISVKKLYCLIDPPTYCLSICKFKILSQQVTGGTDSTINVFDISCDTENDALLTSVSIEHTISNLTWYFILPSLI